MSRTPRPITACGALRHRARLGELTDLLDLELLVLLLRLARPQADAFGLAAQLIARYGDLAGVLNAPAAEVARQAGAAGAFALRLGREAAVRLARAEAARQPVISSSAALLAYVRTELAHLPREQFRVLFLDRKNQLIRDERLGEGTVDHAPVYPREVVRRALELSASGLILLHNHPSGDPAPSAADIDVTRQVVAAARALKIAVHDHLVVGRHGVASLKSLGLM